MPHAECLDQFYAYYQLMRTRTDEAKASEESRIEAISFLEPTGSSKPGIDSMHSGCCYGFSMMRLINLSASLNEVWDQMLMAVEEWDGTYDSLSDRLTIDWNECPIAVTRGAIFRAVMRKVIGIQYRLNLTWRGVDVTAPQVQAMLAEPKFLAPTTVFDVNFTSSEKIEVTKSSLIKKLRNKQFQAECKSGVGLSCSDHQTILHYSDTLGWWFDDINEPYGKNRTKSPSKIADAIINSLGKTINIDRLENRNLALIEDLLPLVEETEMDQAFIEELSSFFESQGCLSGGLSEDSIDELLGLSGSSSLSPVKERNHDKTLNDLAELSDCFSPFSLSPVKERNHDKTLNDLAELSDCFSPFSPSPVKERNHDKTLNDLAELSDLSFNPDVIDEAESGAHSAGPTYIDKFGLYQPQAKAAKTLYLSETDAPEPYRI